MARLASSVRRLGPPPLLVVITALTAACGEPTAPPRNGEVVIDLVPLGASLDADGYTVQVDGSLSLDVPIVGERVIALRNGSHDLELFGVAPNCEVAGGIERDVAIVDGEAARIGFEVTCAPVWRALSFTTDRDGDSEIYATGLDGSYAVRLTADPAEDADAAWSPDGARVAFVRKGSVFEADADMQGPTPLVPAVEGSSWGALTWSPDGSRLGFQEGRWDDWCPSSRIWLMDTADQRRWHLTDGEDPSWSPDGTRLLFSHSPGPCIGPTLRVVNPDGSDPVDLTTGGGFDSGGTWAPDGSRIAFTRHRDGNTDIYTIAADGTDLRRLTRHPAADSQPAWSPDGAWIAFTSERDGNREIYVIAANGSDPVNLTNHPANDSDPAWRRPAAAGTAR